MKLQQEANAHVNRKRNKFKKEINELIVPLRTALKDNLYSTPDLDNALLHLIEAEMWIRRSAERSGIKS